MATTPSTVTLDSRSIRDLADALKGSSGGGFRSGSGGGASATPLSIAGAATTVAKSVISGIGDGLENLKKVVTTNVEVWKKLSNAGANFSNDVIGMSTAAYEARVSLEDFAGIIDRNAKNFAGLGGSVTRGVEAFAKLTRDFQDNDISRQMMQLGYTSTEANEMLALQIGFMKNKFSLDKAMQSDQFGAVNKLATEMDLLSKITGQSRDEQTKLLKQAQDDAAIEAKFKLIGIREGADAEKAARQNFGKEMMAAQARGQGDLFKDFFLTGTVRSKEAAMQAAIGGQAAQETGKSALALAKGNASLAAEYNKSANTAMVALNKNTAFLDIVTRSGSEIGGAVSNVAGTLAKVNDPLVQSVTAIENENKRLGKVQQDYATILERIRDDAIKSQQGQRISDKTGKYEDVAAGTRAVIDSQKFAKDLAATAAGALKEVFKPAVDDFATQVSNSIAALQPVNGNIRESIVGDVEKGIATLGAEGGAIGKVASAVQQGSSLVADGVSGLLKGLTDLFTNGKAVVTIKGVAAKASGGPVGLNGPEIVLTGEEGPEYVLNDKLAKDFVKSAVSSLPKPTVDTKSFAESMKESVNKGMNQVGVGHLVKSTPTAPGINLGELSKGISTSISSVSGGGSTTTNRVESADSKAAQEELATIRKTFEEDWQARKSVLIEGMAVEDRKYSKVQAAMKADATAMKIKEDFEKKREELEKRAAAGVTYEIEKKQEALDETKKIVQEQAAVLNASIVNTAEKTSEFLAENLTVDKEENNSQAIETSERQRRASAKSQAEQKTVATASKSSDSKIPGMNEMIQNLAKSSGIKDANKIFPGQKIKLPDGSEHVVKAGDTLSKIAQQSIKDMQSKISSPKEETAGQAKSSTQQAGKVTETSDSQAIANSERQRREAAKARSDQSTPAKSQQPAAKAATLDDVVKSLEMLNKMLGQLVSVNQDIGKQQIRALKNNSSNIIERMTP